MSKKVDERVVQMEFDNKNFESNVKTSLSTIERLKNALNFKGSTKGLENVDKSVKKVDMSTLAKGVDAVSVKFSALQVASATVFANMTNMAINTGKNIATAFTLDSVIDGFHEYEMQIKSVQTILANTKSKGTTIDQVNSALDELNTYADKTIYNFGEMTKNIGTFTAAGVDLEKAVAAIKGIANLGAMSGSTSMQVSSAMYQLSQALAAGRVSLMDWNSVVNAGMGGEQFQNALIRTSRVMGTGVDEAIKKYGTFRESLTQGQWLTTEVLTETLKQISGAYSEADLIAQGYTEDQAKAIVEMANTATEAATQVKTFTDLISTTKEELGSGWAQSFETIIGDYEEAADLFTKISQAINKPIGESADARNKMLETWADLGGRSALISGLSTAFQNLASVLGKVKEGFTNVFPPMTGAKLFSMTASFKDFAESLTPTAENLERIKRISAGVFSVLSLVGKGVKAIVSPITDFVFSDGVGSFVDGLLEMAAKLGDFFTALNNSTDANNFLKSFSDGFGGALSAASGALDGFMSGFDTFTGAISTVAELVGDAFKGVIDTIKSAFQWIADNIGAGDIFAGLAGGGLFIAFKKFSGLLDKIKDTIDNIFGGDDSEGGSKFSDVLDSLQESLSSFTTGIQVGSLVAIAVAVGILSASLKSLSDLNVPEIASSLSAMAGIMMLLNGSFAVILKTLSKYDAKGIMKASVSMIAIAAAVKIYASALKSLSDLDIAQIGKGLLALGVGLGGMAGAMASISKSKISVSHAIAIMAVAQACKTLAGAVEAFSGLSFDQIGRGLTGMGGALAELTASLAILSKAGGGGAILGSASIFITAQSLAPISDALSSIGSLDWETIEKGLAGMGGALLGLAGFIGILGKVSGISGILGSGAILIAAQALAPISDALSEIGDLSWDEIAKGLVGMGGALLELGGLSAAVGKISGVSGILGSGTILIAAQALEPIGDALQDIGSMSWEEIGRGLTGMAGALAVVGGVSFLTGLGGFASLAGAGTISIAVQSLDQLSNAFQKFASMSWDEVESGLAAMGGALLELAVGSIANSLGILGSLSISTVAEPLGVLADSVKKWADVTVPEDLGDQLGILASGIEKFTLAGFGGGAISTVAEPLGVLADSVKKWTGVTVPDGIADNLKILADAVGSFVFAGFAGGGLQSVAEPLGTLADSVKKWTGVTVPENLEANLKGLAAGVKSFDFSFGMSLDSFVEPFASLADSVKKWDGVSVPENIESVLKGIAAGVKSFDWSWGSSLESFIDPLDQLGDVLPKYSHLAVATDIGDSIKSLGEGVKSLSDKNPGDISGIADAIKSLGDSVTAIGSIDFASATSAIKSFVDSLNGINISTDAFSDLGNKIVDGLSATITQGVPRVQAAIFMLMNGISSIISIASVTLSTSGLTIGSSIATGISQGILSASSMIRAGISSMISAALTSARAQAYAFASIGSYIASSISVGIMSASGTMASASNAIVSSSITVLNGRASSFSISGLLFSTNLSIGILSGKGSVDSSVTSIASSASNILRSYYGSFSSAGSYVAQGFANGIRSGAWAASMAATAMANAAKRAAERALDEHSPSKVFEKIGSFASKGMAIGIKKLAGKVVSETSNMANASIDVAHGLVSKMAYALNQDIDYEPKITPVVDLSNVESGVMRANKLFNGLLSNDTIGNVKIVGGIANAKNQNGSFTDVVKAVSKLGDKIDGISKPSYIVDGITYDDGSNVASAVEGLIHATKIERRI